MCFCDPFSHSIDVDIQSGKVFVKHHHDVLCSSVRKRRNENRPPPTNHVLNSVDESADLIRLWGMVTSTVRALNKQNVCLNGFSSFDQRRISRVKITGQKDAGFGGLNVKHSSARYVTRRMQGQIPRMMFPRHTEIVNVPRIKGRVDVTFVPCERIAFD